MQLYTKRLFQMCKGRAFTSPLLLRSRYTSNKCTEDTEEPGPFTWSETRALYYSLRCSLKLKEIGMATNGVGVLDDSKTQEIDDVLATMESKINNPRVLPFSWITGESLKYLNIRKRGNLVLKLSCKELMDVSGLIGNEGFWSSEELHRHLCMLHDLVPLPEVNQAATRLWINAFLFRAVAMVPKDKQMVLNVEHVISATVNPHSSTTVLGDFVDYIAVMGTPSKAELFLMNPTVENLKEFHHMLFVSEARSRDVSLEMNIPQAVSEMYVCAKELEKTMIRGALSDGQNWIFFILKINSDGIGAKYAVSERIPLNTGDCLPGLLPSRNLCNLISGIMSYWIEHGDQDIDDKDWFTASWY